MTGRTELLRLVTAHWKVVSSGVSTPGRGVIDGRAKCKLVNTMEHVCHRRNYAVTEAACARVSENVYNTEEKRILWRDTGAKQHRSTDARHIRRTVAVRKVPKGRDNEEV